MDKRYQVFVSSTYVDLREERQNVIQTLMKMDCIPAGMELFPAADEEQWEFIKKVIDDCDYYLLILGGRYGSLAPDGMSYTEKEFDYAVSKGIRIIALLHEAPDELPVKKSENNPENQHKLSQFRDKVSDGRLVQFWKEPKELAGLVSLSLISTIKMYPAIGWVRANKIAREEALSDLTKVQKEKEELVIEIKKLKKEIANYKKRLSQLPDELVPFDSQFELQGSYDNQGWGIQDQWNISLTWREIFQILAPSLLEHSDSGSLLLSFLQRLYELEKIPNNYTSISSICFDTILIQLIGYNLITRNNNANSDATLYTLTGRGEQMLLEERTIKASQSKPLPKQ